MCRNITIKPNKDNPKSLEGITMYTSGKFIEIESEKSSTKLEILGIINSLNCLHLYIENDQFMIWSDYKNIIEFYDKVQNKIFKKKSSFISRRWIYFLEVITGQDYKATFEHMIGKNNELVDILFRLIIYYLMILQDGPLYEL